MYADNHRRSASQRVNDEFLRRMTGGELTSNAEQSVQASLGACLGKSESAKYRDSAERESDCPTTVPAPSLAMVYSPRQCWRNVLSPEEGLRQGSIFSDLVLPFEPYGNGGNGCGCNSRGTEVRTRR